MKEKIYYKIWSELDGKFIKSSTKTNFLYQSEKACMSVIDDDMRFNERSFDNYIIKKYKLVEVIE